LALQVRVERIGTVVIANEPLEALGERETGGGVANLVARRLLGGGGGGGGATTTTNVVIRRLARSPSSRTTE
jgi:hypothetical protein